MRDYWFYLSVNPEPWSVGDAFVGRKGGNFFARISPQASLVAYQQAVKEELEEVDELPKGQYSITFYLWRQQAKYLNERNHKITKHQADTTNMQKGLEDALQGVLFDNDRNVQDIRTRIVEQSPQVKPCVVIRASLLQEFNPDEIPDHIWDAIERKNMPRISKEHLKYQDSEDLF